MNRSWNDISDEEKVGLVIYEKGNASLDELSELLPDLNIELLIDKMHEIGIIDGRWESFVRVVFVSKEYENYFCELSKQLNGIK